MNKIKLALKAMCLVLISISCNNEKKATDANTEKVTNPAILNKPEEFIGVYCFMKAENKDTTIVRLNFLSDEDIRGEMIWHPFQKDGAKGELKGKLNLNREMELKYDYVIEGSHQTETKIMKIVGDTLSIKRGELIDPKNDGNLVFKDSSKAIYNSFLTKTKCD